MIGVREGSKEEIKRKARNRRFFRFVERCRSASTGQTGLVGYLSLGFAYGRSLATGEEVLKLVRENPLNLADS